METRARPAAGPEDVLAGLSVRHEAYGRTMPLLEYLAKRLGNAKEHRSVPWVLELGDGTVVATLLCHRLELALDDRVVPAYGLGSVGTRPAHRRRGHAAALCRAACEAGERDGRPVGLLFSGIAPAYYERLGFRASPAWGHRCDRLRELAESGPAAALAPVDPRREAEALARSWRDFHRGVLHPRRDAARFLESVDDGVDDWFFEVRGGTGGYVRLYAEEDGSLSVVEAVVLDPEEEGAVLRAVARVALDTRRAAVSGWLEPTAFVREWFLPASRAENLPMLRGAPPHGAARFFASDHF